MTFENQIEFVRDKYLFTYLEPDVYYTRMR